MARKNVKLAIAGVGNCASSLLQGIEYYRTRDLTAVSGLMHPDVGGYRPCDIEIVAAFDVDRRKVGKPLRDAVFAAPNCTTIFQRDLPDYGVTVLKGPLLDGIAEHMANYPEEQAFRASDAPEVNVADTLRKTGAEVLVCYLPVGSEQAVQAYANACLDAGVAMVNCVPVFIASNPKFAEEFTRRGIPIVGDDIKSQFGATIMHRILVRMMGDRGVRVERTYQLNTGGNTDFLNMLEQSRLKTKKVSKTEAVQSQLDKSLPDDNIHIGPSDFVPWQKDNKVCFLRIEWDGFGGVPMHLEARLSVEDSPNSAGVAIDGIRCAKVALERGLGGPLEAISAYTMKHPPKQMRDSDAYSAVERYIDGDKSTSSAASGGGTAVGMAAKPR
ncbi:MAG: inositol-3-phosphate synthase [Deltaproteobacteria bacterium]|nr:inositol-3-phosphate synthase [Deltaproteobacteria bacterium]